MPRSKFCAVVVTYNGIKWIEKCLASVKSGAVKADTLVIDNGSTDGTVEFLTTSNLVDYLFQPSANLGFGRANNIGLREGYKLGYGYFLLLNQDAWVEPNVLKSLGQSLNDQEDFGVASPMHFNGSGDQLDFLFQNYLSRSPAYQSALKGEGLQERLYESPFLNAACWLIKRKVLERVGLFHPLFDHYGEDDNFIHRLHHAGFKLGIHPYLKAYHDREQGVESSLKNDPFRVFRRQVLFELLNPGSKANFIQIYLKSMKGAKSKSNSGIQLWKFRFKCLAEYMRIRMEVNRFNKYRQSELLLA